MGTQTKIHPLELPIKTQYELPVGREICSLLDTESRGEAFIKGEHYGPWAKGLFDAASFDSFTAEYRIAALLNRAQSIEWWTRLYPVDGAKIAFTQRRTYRPDFVALDKSGYHWIIEGKAESGRDDDEVQLKRNAAEKAVVLLATHPQFAGQKWGYVLAYEHDVASAESWEDLRSHANPVKTPG